MKILREWEDTVMISRADYDQAERDLQWLACLDMAGVDNWCGYDEAIRIMKEYEDG